MSPVEERSIDEAKIRRQIYENQVCEVLELLWDSIAEPVLSTLRFDDCPRNSEWPKLWWCPTGLLSLLPIHASGYHNADENNRTVIDRVVPAYFHSFRSLRHSRSKIPSLKSPTVLIVPMRTTVGYEDLPYAHDEAYGIREIVRKHSPCTVSIVKEPTVHKLRNELQNYTISHFICHALADSDPSLSKLLLNDGPLTVTQISQIPLKTASLAYLSACSTAYNHDLLLQDENITLANAFQLAGYTHVIGSLWATADDIACNMAHTFYALLRNETSRAAEALHGAILEQRARFPREPSLWAPYVYSGA